MKIENGKIVEATESELFDRPQKPYGYAEALSGTEQFMDWYMSEAKGETK